MKLLSPEYPLMIWIAIVLAVGAIWLVALIDIIKHEFKGNHEKLIWILIVVLTPFLGTILYFAMGRKNRLKDNQY